ncbi:hypothetical protein MVES1_002296 [Malassezia vespertilionis]|uniref:uncharacterized protein n=1 Tax=Malassezia vespertilionis TaxID=2020962 RepID=UPI0024B14456|nr:uncharacterized protein MVES1_002296 [Malassezia vespertilionis]WFD06941.1 hypothetical protein MVES1_002296 [Malassezia vespertilionis]
MLPLALLQTLLSRRFLAREEAERCYAALEDAMEERGPGLDDAITLLNERLAGVSLEIRACHDQISRAQFLVLVNTKADTLAELATPYTPTELVYIKAILEAIWTAPQRHYALSSTAALQLAPSLQLSKRAASDLLQDLERRNWIVNRGGYYTMSLRALTELDAYIRNEFEEHVGMLWRTAYGV